MRKCKLRHLPLAVLFVKNLSHHKRAGDLPSADDCLKVNVLQRDRHVAKRVDGDPITFGVLLPNASAFDGVQFLSLAPGPAHVGEHRFVIE